MFLQISEFKKHVALFAENDQGKEIKKIKASIKISWNLLPLPGNLVSAKCTMFLIEKRIKKKTFGKFHNTSQL